MSQDIFKLLFQIFSASPIFFPNNLVFEKLKILKSMNWKNKLFYNNNY